MTVKGWCPGAWRPMMSGDGLIVRVRPRLGRLSAAQVLGLCEVSQRLGNGVIDLTSRANLQLRGVSDHEATLRALHDLELLDDTAEAEARRNITVTPLWTDGDLTHRLHDAICARLDEMPDLPAKMGIAVDCGVGPVLRDCSADFRFEVTDAGQIILRADGARTGRRVTEDTAVSALLDLARWFVDSGGRDAGRMGRHLKSIDLPEDWQGVAPAPDAHRTSPGPAIGGFVYGAPFGSLDARALSALMTESAATALRVTPWRLFLLEGARPGDAQASSPTPPIRCCESMPAPARPPAPRPPSIRARSPARSPAPVCTCRVAPRVAPIPAPPPPRLWGETAPSTLWNRAIHGISRAKAGSHPTTF